MIEENYWNELIVKLIGPSIPSQQISQQEVGEITEERQHQNTNRNECLNLDTNTTVTFDISNGKVGNSPSAQEILYRNYNSTSEGPLHLNSARKLSVEIKTARGNHNTLLPRRSFAVNKHCLIFQNNDKEIEVLSDLDFSIRTKLETPKQDLSDICIYTKPPYTYACLAYPSGIYAFVIEVIEKLYSKCLLQFPIMQVLQTNEMKVEWKNEKKFAMISNKDVTVFSIGQQNQMISEEKEANNYAPAQFLVFAQEQRIVDFAFSQKNHLLFLCLENGITRVINSDNGSKLREFLPFQEPERCKRILLFRNLLPTDTSKGPVAFVPGGDFTLKDIFLTISEVGHIKVWDLGEWNITTQSCYCIQSDLQEGNNQSGGSLQFVMFDYSKTFLFVLRGSEEGYQRVSAYHVNADFYRWTEQYKEIKKYKKFFDHVGEFKLLNSEELDDISIININRNDRLALNFIEIEESMNPSEKSNAIKEEYCDPRTTLEIFYLTKSALSMAVIECRRIYPAFETIDPYYFDYQTFSRNQPKKTFIQQTSVTDLEKVGESSNPQMNGQEIEIIDEGEEDEMVTEDSGTLNSKTKDSIKSKESLGIKAQIALKSQNTETKNKLESVSLDIESKSKSPRKRKRFTDYVDYPRSESAYSSKVYSDSNFKDKTDQKELEEGQLPLNFSDPGTKKQKSINLKTSPSSKSKPRKDLQALENERNQSNNEKHISSKNPLKLKIASKKLFQKPSNSLRATENIKDQIANQLNQNNSIYENPSLSSAKSSDLVREENKVQENATGTKESSSQVQWQDIPLAKDLSIERILDSKLKTFTDDYLKYFDTKFAKIEQIIENKIEERISKLQMSSTPINVDPGFDTRLTTMFSHAFENQVTPSLERYLVKLFEQINNTFKKGQEFYSEKLNIEQTKATHMREGMNEMLKSFLQISNTLTENAVSNQSTFSKLEMVFQDKESQIIKMINQISKMVTKQKELQKKLENTEREVVDSLSRLRDEIKGQLQLPDQKQSEENKYGKLEGNNPAATKSRGLNDEEIDQPHTQDVSLSNKSQRLQQQQMGIPLAEPRQFDKSQQSQSQKNVHPMTSGGIQSISPGVFQSQMQSQTSYNQASQIHQDFPPQNQMNQGHLHQHQTQSNYSQLPYTQQSQMQPMMQSNYMHRLSRLKVNSSSQLHRRILLKCKKCHSLLSGRMSK